MYIFATPDTDAQVAKLVDALCSGRSARKGVLVRIQSWAPLKPCKSLIYKAFLFPVCHKSVAFFRLLPPFTGIKGWLVEVLGAR